MKKLYVGNLPFKATEADLRTMFSQFGEVSSAKIVTDRDDGRSKGFGFIEMADDAAAEAAVAQLDGQEYEGRNLRVSEAREREGGGGGGGGYGGGGGGGGGGGYRGGPRGGGGGGGGRHGGGGGGYGGGRDRY